MIRKLCAALVLLTLTIAVGGMACGSPVVDLDTADETDGATMG